MTFYEIYEKCCINKGIKPASQNAADKIGCSKANISALSKNGNSPKGDIIAGAAKMLDVSADYLLGLIDEPRGLGETNNLTQKENNVLSMLRELNDEGQEAVIAMISGLLAQDIYKKSSSDTMAQEKRA